MHRLRAALLPELVTSEQIWTEQSDTERKGLIKRNFTSISLGVSEKFSSDLCYFRAGSGSCRLACLLCRGEMQNQSDTFESEK